MATYVGARLDARLAHLKSAESIRMFRENLSLARNDRPKIVERGDLVVAMRADRVPCDEVAEDDPCEQAPIWLQELRTRPALPPPHERGVVWRRSAGFLIACGIAAPLSYYFAVATSPLHEHLIEVSAAPPSAAQVVSGLPLQKAPETRDGSLASIAGPHSASAEQGALTIEPAFAQLESPRSPPSTTGVAEDRPLSLPPERVSVLATKAANSQDVKLMTDRGKQFFEAGDLISARILFARAANTGDAAAAVAMGTTYDPIVLANRGVLGVAANLDKARSWYERAKEMGSPEGPRRLETLANR